MKKLAGIAAALGLALAWSSTAGRAAAPPRPAGPEPVDVIFDTDMSLDVDDVGALALLHALANRGECRILAVGISESARAYDGLWAAPLADAINTWYGRPGIPVGVFRGPHQEMGEKGRYAEKTAKAFPHRLQSGAAAPSAFKLYRRILAGRPDGSVVMISVGFLTNLDALLESGPDELSPLDGVELVRKKVKHWACMGGRYPSSGEGSEFNLATYPEATAYVLGHWPTPATFSGGELGEKILTGARLMKKYEPARSPVARAYREYTGGKDRMSWDQTAALFAVRGLAHEGQTYFTAVTEGHNRFELTAGPPGAAGAKPQPSHNAWVAEPDAEQAYLVAAMPPAQLARIIEDLMMQPPARARR
jgi:inosine-uridine nucleoside N-ribohydrolase